MLHSHQIKIATDWLQTGFWLTSESKIGVQSEASPIGQSGANLF